MKFSCEKEKLLSALTIVSRNVAAKSTIQALEGVLVEVTDVLELTGYNLETGVQATVPANVEEKGTLVLTAKLFLDIIRKMPNQEIFFVSEDYWVTISCGVTKFQIMGLDSAEFPELPDVTTHQGFTTLQSTLKAMINTTYFAISTSEGRVVHTGSLFEIENDKLTMVAVDGYRLALRRENLDSVFGGTTFSFVIPRDSLLEVEKICSGDEEIAVYCSDQHVMFKTEHLLLVSRRLEGEFLVYRSAIPQGNKFNMIGERRNILAGIDRASLMITELAKVPLRCMFGDEKLVFSCKTSLGAAEDTCVMEGDGEDMEIGFNHRYLQEALKAAPADKVRVEFSNPVAPCLILPAKEEDESFCYMVLPVRLKSN